jgi:hypothetical protein
MAAAILTVQATIAPEQEGASNRCYNSERRPQRLRYRPRPRSARDAYVQLWP